MRLRVITALLAAGLLVAAGITAQGATAATPALIGSANGVVGISQVVEVRAPGFANQTVGLNFTLVGQVRSTATVSINAAGAGSTVWTPTDAGTWNISGTGSFASATASTLTIAAVPTITTLYAVNQAQVNVATTMTAVVQSTGGTSSPVGSVTFTNPVGTALATVGLTSLGNGKSSADFSWTSTSTTERINITATYNPAPGFAGGANWLTSSSTDGIQVLATNPTVSLKLPGSFTVGRPIDVAAVINGPNNVTVQGTVAFTTNVNGNVTSIAGSLPIQNAQASAPWTPASTGNQVITASFSASNSNESGTGTQIISVNPALASDPISFGVQGSAAWPSGATVSVPANASLQLFTTTGSGAPTNISESGPCLINGNTVVAATGAGTCTVTVTSPGTTTFAANQASVTLDIQAPAKKKAKKKRR